MDINSLLSGLSRARQQKKPEFDPNALQMDDGRTFDARRLRPGQLGSLGEQQEDSRRSYENRRDWKSGRVLRTNTNAVGISPQTRGWFGAMQMKENAARAGGKKLEVDFAGVPGSRQNSGWGTWGYQADGGPSQNLLHDARTAKTADHPALQALAGLRRYRR